jgi:hypothetical protein
MVFHKGYISIEKICGFAVVLPQLLFTLLLALKLDNYISASWVETIIPLVISFITIPVSINIYLCYSTRTVMALGNIVMLFTAYSVSFGSLISATLFACKMDSVIDDDWVVLFIPLWVSAFVVAMFACFMCPGMVDSKIRMHRQAFLLFAYVAVAVLEMGLVAV